MSRPRRPPLAILGISPSFARAHRPEVIVAVADAIYRAAASRYHPDRGADAVPLPAGVNLTEMQAARDAVREDPRACIREVQQTERASKEEKRSGELTERLSTLEEIDAAWSHDVALLWDFIARQKLGLKIDEEAMENKIAYSTLHLNGLAVLVTKEEHGKGHYYEYLRHKDAWFKRPMMRSQFSKRSPIPPGVPPELLFQSISATADQGHFYDQSGPHELLEGFEILGSYTKKELAEARAKKRRAAGEKPDSEAPSLNGGPSLNPKSDEILDPLVASVLKPRIVVGAVLQAAMQGGRSVRYSKAGIITSVRIFDPKQRP